MCSEDQVPLNLEVAWIDQTFREYRRMNPDKRAEFIGIDVCYYSGGYETIMFKNKDQIHLVQTLYDDYTLEMCQFEPLYTFKTEIGKYIVRIFIKGAGDSYLHWAKSNWSKGKFAILM